MSKLVTTGESFTTLSVSAEVAKTVLRKKGGMTTDGFLRKLLRLPTKQRRRGRPPKNEVPAK
jgi:hypothetical protein